MHKIKNMIKRILFFAIKIVDKNPKLRASALAFVNKFPSLKRILKRVASSSVVQTDKSFKKSVDLSPDAKKIYKRLKGRL